MLYAASLALALSPLLALEYPPLLDYPNHLARLHILINPDDAVLSRYWRADWKPVPNLGFDLVGYVLAGVMSVEAAGRLFLAMSFAVALGGPLALHRALYGRVSPLPLVAGALIFNRVLQMGFLGYFLGLGLAVWAFAGWIALRQRSQPLRLGLMQGAALLLVVCHLYAMAVLAVLVTLSAASAGWRVAAGAGTARTRGALAAALPELLPFVLPVFLMLVASETAAGGHGIGYEPAWLKLVQLPMALMLEPGSLGLALAGAVLVPPALAWLGGGRVMHPAVTWPVAAMLGLYVVMPDVLISENADWRLVVPLSLVVAGAAEDPFRDRRRRAAVAGLVLVVNAAAAWNAWTHWRGSERMLADFRAAVAPVEQGALLVSWFPGPEYRNAFRPPSVLNIATLAVIERKAFVPMVFAFAGLQPIALREPYDALPVRLAGLRPDALLAAAKGKPGLSARYVLEIHSGRPIEGSLPDLPVAGEMVTSAGNFTLWRVE